MHERGTGFLFRFDKCKVLASKSGKVGIFCNSCLKIACICQKISSYASL